jgi:streptogramin lyase
LLHAKEGKMKIFKSAIPVTLVIFIFILFSSGPVCAGTDNQKLKRSIVTEKPASSDVLGAALDFDPPTNDECTTATTIGSVQYVDSIDATMATANGSDPVLSCGGGGGGRTVWYTFTPSNSMQVTAITFGSNYDTVLGIFIGSCGSLEEIHCDDDELGVQSAVTWNALEGVTYYIHVAEFSGGSGAGNLIFSLIPGNLEVPTFVREFAGAGNDPGYIAFSVGVAVDNDCNVFIADWANNYVHKFRYDGEFIRRWQGSGDSELGDPGGVDTDDNGNVYVADESYHRIQKYTTNGTAIINWGSNGTGNSEFNYPTDVAVDRNSWVYVADALNYRIQKFNTSGGYVRQWGTSGTGDGQFDLPIGIAVGPDRNVYVADLNNNRIQKFTALGVFITKWGSSGTGNGQFDQPRGVTVDSDGFVYVADADNNRIQKFTSAGIYLMKWGTQGADVGYFDDCRDVAVDESGNIYVMDTVNFRVQVFAPSPEPLLMSAVDVGNDQGRNVRISLQRSRRDGMCSPSPILQYEVFRRVDPLSAPSRTATPSKKDDIGKMLSSAGILLQGWEFAGAIPAHGETGYEMIVPTLADSTIADGMHWSVFFVRAATSDPLVYYDSEPDSGYSVDNLAPGVPLGLSVAYNTGSGNQLSWEPSPEEDFQYFRIYRDEDPDFVPGPSSLVDGTVETSWSDPSYDGWPVYYKITAVDFSGNESDPASAGVTTDADAPPVPEAFVLHQNVPNPFNPSTTIRFDLPKRTHVRLSVYNLKGQLVRVLVNRVIGEGSREVVWNGQDGRGRIVASGIYFYSLVAGDFAETRKMVLLR